MDAAEIIRRRLANQALDQSSFKKPEEAVAWMTAMQGQEWAMVTWALALRVPGLAMAAVEAAFDAGRILRTHLLRPTWHLVAPADIRWLLNLTKPRVHQANAYMYRKLELDAALLKRCHGLLGKALAGGPKTRVQLAEALEKGKVKAEGLRMGYILMHAELEALIASGPRAGKQFTYALLDDRAPKARALPREEALARLGGRYFASRGPATAQDLAYWSGLTSTESKKAFHLAAESGPFAQETWDGKAWLFPRVVPSGKAPAPKSATFLLPDYDEYGMSYKDRSAAAGPMVPSLGKSTRRSISMGQAGPITDHMAVVDGKVAGTWRRAVKGKEVLVETDSFATLGAAKEKAVKQAAERYRAFFAGSAGAGTEPAAE